MGRESREVCSWRVASEGSPLSLHYGTVAVLTEAGGPVIAKVMTEKSNVHWLLFATDSQEQRVELRLSADEAERLANDLSNLQRPTPTSAPKSPSSSTQPAGGLLFDLAGRPSTLAELLTAPVRLHEKLRIGAALAESKPSRSGSTEQIPLVLMVNALLCSPRTANPSHEDEAVFVFLDSMLRFLWFASSLDEDLDKLVTEAETRRLLTQLSQIWKISGVRSAVAWAPRPILTPPGL